MKKKILKNNFKDLEYCDDEENKKLSEILDKLTPEDLEIVEEHPLINLPD